MKGRSNMNQYQSNVYAQAREVDRKLRLPNLLAYEKRSLLGRKLGLQVHVRASASMRADMERRAQQRKQKNVWG